MRRLTMAGGRLGTALCAAALVAQAALLPVLHAEHGAVATLERVLARTAASPAGGAAAVGACDRASASAHDLASCPVCATLGRTGIALAPAATVPGALPEHAEVPRAASSILATAPDIARGAPRGPPAHVS